MHRLIRYFENLLMAVIEKGRLANQFAWAGFYLTFFITAIFVIFLFRPNSDYIYKGVSFVFLIKLAFLPAPIFLMLIACFFKRSILRNVGLLLALPIALLFSFFALISITDLISILLKGYDPALEQLHRINYSDYDVVVYRDIPHMAFDPFSILIRQEKEMKFGIIKTRTIHYQYRCDNADYEILTDNRIRFMFGNGMNTIPITLIPF